MSPTPSDDTVPAAVFDNFEKAFRTSGSGAVRHCRCGRVFYEPGGGWTWGENELATLDANPQATALDWSAGSIIIEGKEYALDCTCWHPRARRIILWIQAHVKPLADFINAEKKRKVREAETAPEVTP